MPRRKRLLLIVEGTSDANALQAPLEGLFTGATIGTHEVRCDVMTAKLFPASFEKNHGFSPTPNIQRTMGELVDEYISAHGQVTDLGWIAHLTDLDGAYAPDSAVLTGNQKHGVIYGPTTITVPNRNHQLEILAEKRRCIDELIEHPADYERRIKTHELWHVPYRLFYMSRNLEHALHGIADACEQDEKEDYAAQFAEDNLDPHTFRASLQSAANAHGGASSWKASWDYVRNRSTFHSLSSGSNLIWMEDFIRNNQAHTVKG